MPSELTKRTGDPALAISASGQLSVTGDAIGDAYSARVFIHQTAGTADNTCVWAMLNAGATLSVRISSIDLAVAYCGVAAIGDTVLAGYSLHKFTTAVPGGGTAEAVALHDVTNAASVVTNIRSAAAGLTMTNSVYGAPIANVMTTLGLAGSVASFSLARGGREIVLAPGEGFAILLEGTAAAGLHIVGGVTWVEV